jgi:hypothetical protein
MGMDKLQRYFVYYLKDDKYCQTDIHISRIPKKRNLTDIQNTKRQMDEIISSVKSSMGSDIEVIRVYEYRPYPERIDVIECDCEEDEIVPSLFSF